ncbi:MAG: MMPL family transporter [Candidatus Omnitrophica bacterium]|nr:MMPL family transporter [Candidatus Omnitrophota bacterium]
MIKRIFGFSVEHTRLVILLTLIVTCLFLWQFPKIKVDTDPKHMLPTTSPVRVYNDEVDRLFSLHADTIVLGISNKEGIINTDTLKKVALITQSILKIKGVITQDLLSLSTVNDVIVKEDGLQVRPLLDQIPETKDELETMRKVLYENPMLVDRFISKDGKTTAVYIPIEPAANGKAVADLVRKIVKEAGPPEEYYLAGDPIARDTFGSQMFKQMGLFSPVSGMVMCVALFLMFRNYALVFTNMGVAMISIFWSLGLLIGMGFPVHIMSSMMPVFLMAISTDTVHIFNEFYFRFREVKDKRRAVLETMNTVAQPVFYSDLTTAVGFASLATGAIVPVKVFGLFVAFGTFVILLMSYTFVPAILMVMKESTIQKALGREDIKEGKAQGMTWLVKLGGLSLSRRSVILKTGLILIIFSVIGISRIHVNNNMVSWFKAESEIRRSDKILNKELGGTSLAYFVLDSDKEDFIKEPSTLRYMETLQRRLEQNPLVGKTTSVADYVKHINRVLHQNDPKFEVIPGSKDEVAQYLFLMEMSARPNDLNNVVDYPFKRANIWVQLKSWDAGVMRELVQAVQKYTLDRPLPEAKFKPAGIAYFNMVWNDEVLWGMVSSFLASLVLVLGLLIFEYRSLKWGIISFIPLLATIVIIYGMVGWIGKDFDMPISVLSTLSLGMAIDFAIHFVSRLKQRYQEIPDVEDALAWTVGRPGKGIIRNAVLFALGFAVMMFASLTPYITVGIFMALIMILSSVATLIYLPALIIHFKESLSFKGGR